MFNYKLFYKHEFMFDLDKINTSLEKLSLDYIDYESIPEMLLPEVLYGEPTYIEGIDYIRLLSDEYILEFVSIISDKIMHILRRMRITLYNRICAVKASYYHRIFSFFSLLYGLCNSHSSFIFHSLYGCSVSRIPA